MNTFLLKKWISTTTLLWALLSLIIIVSCKDDDEPVFSGTVSGTVADANDPTKKLEGVLVELLQGAEVVTSTQTNSNGSFSLTVTNLKGTEVFSVKGILVGYEEYYAEQFEFSAGDNQEKLSINLVPKPKIRGTVRHKVSLVVLSNVSVNLSPTDQTITTDQFGEYLFENLEKGTYRLTVSKSSFETLTLTAQLASGEDKVQDVNLAPLAAILNMDKQTLDFGSTETTLPLILKNTGGDTIRWSVIESISWASANPLSGVITTDPVTLNINVDRTGVIPGNYTQTMTISSNGGTFTLTVSMNVQGTLLQIAPTEINFGTTTSETSLQLTRIGTGTLNYEVQSDKSWLTISPANGSVSNEIDFITVKADRLSLAIGNHSARLAFNTDNGSQIVNVAITIPDPSAPQLSMEPLALNFGTDDATKILSLSNTGKGSVQWTATKAATWLIVSSVTGTLAEGTTQDITIQVNRTSLNPNQYSDVLRFTSNGGNINVPVSMEVANTPVLSVDPVNLAFKRGVDQLTFTIQNIGNGQMEWQISTNTSWITLNPLSGTNQGTVNVTVNRTDLSYGTYSGQVDITSDGGNSQVLVELQHPAPNDPPVASFTSSRTTADVGETIVFDASTSTDPQDATNTLEARWRFDVGLAFSDWNTYKLASYEYTDTGVKEVTLEVRDIEGEGSTANKTITIVQNQAPNAFFSVSPSSGEQVNTVFNFDASGSTDDIDALSTLQVRWEWEAGLGFTDWTLTKTASRTYDTEGTKTITLEVKDSHGLTDTYSTSIEVVSNNDTDGDGVKDNVDADDDNNGLIEIWTINDLNDVRNDLTATGAGKQGAPLGGFTGYELMKDLDFSNSADYSDASLKASVTSGSGWMPIGESGKPFATTFEGDGHVIKNLFLDRVTDYTGLFRELNNLAKIQNLGIEIQYFSARDYVGGLVGNMNGGKVINCYVIGNLTGEDYVGLLAGAIQAGGLVEECYAIGGVIGGGFVGGLVGQNGYSSSSIGTIKYSYTDVLVKGNSISVGGLVGHNSSGVITFCYSLGDVSSGGYYTGGLVGYQYAGVIASCYATGDVASGSYSVGGLIGSIRNIYPNPSITASYSTGSVAGTSYVGGFIGYYGFSDPYPTCYWDIETSGKTTSAAGTGKTTAELQGPTSTTGIYSTWDPDDWDFGTSSQYPALKNMPGGLERQRE